MKNLFILCLSCLLANFLSAQDLSQRYASRLTLPSGYVCYRPTDEITIDGFARESSWELASATAAFVDICGEGFAKPRHHTEVKMLWDENYLYILAYMEEPHLWGTLYNRDEVVYFDNDFEVFIDPTGTGHNYFEIEVNVLGTIFDLAIDKPYRAPGGTFAQFQWNAPGLKLAVQCEGTINDPSDVDKAWTVEMAIPYQSFASGFNNYLVEGNWLRVNFSRVQYQFALETSGGYAKKTDAQGKPLPEDNWVWTPTGEVAMHMPERWGYLFLSGMRVGHGVEAFHYPEKQCASAFLWMLFYAQEEYYKYHRRYINHSADFNLSEKDRALLPDGYEFSVEATTHTYEVTVRSPQGKQWVVNEAGKHFERIVCDYSPIVTFHPDRISP